MRIDELKQEVQRLGRLYNVNLRVREELNYIFIDRCDGETCNAVALLETKQMYTINTDMFHFINLPYGLKDELLNLLVKFVRTPIDKREEKKKYYYRLKEKYWWILKNLEYKETCLNLRISKDGEKRYLTLDNDIDIKHYKTIFTDKEMEEVVEEFDIDLNMFDKIEVE